MIETVKPSDLSFHSIFFFFLSLTYGLWLYRYTTVDFVHRFCVGNLDDMVVSIGKRNQIKYLFVNMFYLLDLCSRSNLDC